jgi:hypothetical protein
MIVKLEDGTEVDCGGSRLAGREVRLLGTISGKTIAPEEGEVWMVVNEHHGDHDTDWVVVFKGGFKGWFETMRMRLESSVVTEVVWKEPIA